MYSWFASIHVASYQQVFSLFKKDRRVSIYNYTCTSSCKVHACTRRLRITWRDVLLWITTAGLPLGAVNLNSLYVSLTRNEDRHQGSQKPICKTPASGNYAVSWQCGPQRIQNKEACKQRQFIHFKHFKHELLSYYSNATYSVILCRVRISSWDLWELVNPC